MRLRARMHVIVALSHLAASCIVLAACAGDLQTAAPAAAIAPAEPDPNPLGDDPEVIPFDRSAAYDHGFASRGERRCLPHPSGPDAPCARHVYAALGHS